MPLPPAPTQRASRLTHTAFENTESENIELENETPAFPPEEKAPSKAARQSDPPTPKPKRATTDRSSSDRTEPARAEQQAPSKQRAMPAPTRPKRRTGPSKLFVLDTNVLMHDPMSLFRFEEHDVFLPMIVLEELDGHKKGMTEVARNARQASRSLDALAQAQGADLGKGSPLNTTGHNDATGQLFFLSLIHISEPTRRS